MTEPDTKPTPMTLDDLATQCDRLRSAALFGELYGNGPVADGGLDLMAEQEFLIALSHLELAQRHAAKAALLQTRAIAASPYRQ